MDGPTFIPPNPQIKQQQIAEKQASDKLRVNQSNENADKSGAKGPSPQEKSAAADKFEQIAKDEANKSGGAEKRDAKEPIDKKPQPEKPTDAKETADKIGSKKPTPQEKAEAADRFEQIAKEEARATGDTGKKDAADQPADTPLSGSGHAGRNDQNNGLGTGNDKKTKLTADQKIKKHKDEVRAAIISDSAAVLAGKLGMSSVNGGGSDTEVHLVDQKDKGKDQQAGDERGASSDKNAITDQSRQQSPSAQDKQDAADRFEQIAREEAEKGEKSSPADNFSPQGEPGDKEHLTHDNPKDKPTDSKEVIANLEKRTLSLSQHYDHLVQNQNEFREEYNKTLTNADESFEKIRSTAETMDTVGAFATMLVNLGDMAKIGAKAMASNGKELIKANAKLLEKAKDVANEPLKGVAKDRLAEKINSVFGDGLLSKGIQFGLKVDKPSTWTQLITGDINENHKTITENLTRSFNEANDRTEAEKYRVQQKLLELNAQRDAINSSGYSR